MEDIILMQEGGTPLASFIEKGLVAAWSAKGKNNTDTDRNILKDLSGQGHNITLYGFAYNDESGYSSKYPNALLFDGKNTYGECTNMPIQTDYTIIAKRRILKKITSTPCLMSKAQNAGVGAFIFEMCNNKNNTVQMYSFGQYSAYINPITPITYSTSTNFNGHAIAKGNASDTNYLCLGNIRRGDSNRAWHGAFYWAALFNKSLTKEEIDEFIKVMETPVGSKINFCASKTLEECMEDTKFNLNTLYFPTDSNNIFFNNKTYNEVGKRFYDEGETDPQLAGEIFNDYENNTASGSLSHAEGYNCHAIGENSHAEGSNNMAEGNCSHAEGTYNETYGKNSHAEGEFNTTDGDSSHAEGGNNSVNGNYSHVEGDNNEVSGSSSHVEGSGNICNEANCCHVEGTDNTARGNCSHVEGTSNTSTIENQHIEGQYSKESNSIHIVGIGTSDTNRKNAHEITLEGKHYIPNIGGYDGTNKESAKDLASEFNNKPGRIVQGGEIFNHESNTISSGGVNNHVEGQGTACYSSCGHAEGMDTSSAARSAHSEGEKTVAGGVGSHAEGVGTATSVEGGHVEGKYNAITDSIHIIGGGTSNDNRKNLHEIKTDGKQYVIGVGGYNGTNRDSATDLATIIGEFKAPYIIGFISYASTPADDKLPELLGKPSDVRAAVQDGRPILMVNSTFSTPVTVYCSGTASMTFTWTYCGTSTTGTKIISMRVSYNNTSDTFTTVSTKSTYSLTADA